MRSEKSARGEKGGEREEVAGDLRGDLRGDFFGDCMADCLETKCSGVVVGLSATTTGCRRYGREAASNTAGVCVMKMTRCDRGQLRRIKGEALQWLLSATFEERGW